MQDDALLVIYPLSFTGEWVEAMAGGLFVLTYAPTPRPAGAWAGLGAAVALALTAWRSSASPAMASRARPTAAALHPKRQKPPRFRRIDPVPYYSRGRFWGQTVSQT